MTAEEQLATLHRLKMDAERLAVEFNEFFLSLPHESAEHWRTRYQLIDAVRCCKVAAQKTGDLIQRLEAEAAT